MRHSGSIRVGHHRIAGHLVAAMEDPRDVAENRGRCLVPADARAGAAQRADRGRRGCRLVRSPESLAPLEPGGKALGLIRLAPPDGGNVPIVGLGEVASGRRHRFHPVADQGAANQVVPGPRQKTMVMLASR